MELYYRLGEAAAFADIDELLNEMKDRLGDPPEPVLWLYHLTRIRVLAAANHITLLKFQNVSLLVERLVGKKTEQQTFLITKKFATPADLEAYATKIINLSQ